MLAIIKIDESFAVVDLDEDTELFESLDEAEDVMLEYMSQSKLDAYRRKTRGKQIAVSRLKGERKHATTIKKAADAENKLSAAKEKLAHRQIRLQQREKAKKSVKSAFLKQHIAK